MSLEIYRVLHILGVLTLFSGLAALWGVYASVNAPVTPEGPAAPVKKWRGGLALFHGLGLTIILVSGFGMLARLGLAKDLPPWAIAKFVVWLVLGGSVALAKRKSAWGIPLLTAWVLLGTLAAYLCVFKPS